MNRFGVFGAIILMLSALVMAAESPGLPGQGGFGGGPGFGGSGNQGPYGPPGGFPGQGGFPGPQPGFDQRGGFPAPQGGPQNGGGSQNGPGSSYGFGGPQFNGMSGDFGNQVQVAPGVNVNYGSPRSIAPQWQNINEEEMMLGFIAPTIFKKVGKPEELLALCPNVDAIVEKIDKALSDSDISPSVLCADISSGAVQCKDSSQMCEDLKKLPSGPRGPNGEAVTCPVDSAKLVDACKQRFSGQKENDQAKLQCEQAWDFKETEITRICSQQNNNNPSGYDQRKPYDKNPQPGQPQGDRSTCPTAPSCASGYAPMLGQDSRGCANWGQCPNTNSNTPNSCPSITMPSCSSGQYPQPVYSSESRCPSSYTCSSSGNGNYSSCTSIPVPSCSSGQWAQPNYASGSMCPSSYTCTATTGSTSCPATTMPNCPSGQYAQAQSGQNTPCPSNYQCVTSPSGGMGSCAQPPSCPSGQYAQYNAPQNGQSCGTYGSCISSGNGAYGSSGTSCPSVSMPSCSNGQYAQATYSNGCPTSYSCVSSGSSGGSATCMCPPDSNAACSSGMHTVTVTQQMTPSGCTSSLSCPVSHCEADAQAPQQPSSANASAARISGLFETGGFPMGANGNPGNYPAGQQGQPGSQAGQPNGGYPNYQPPQGNYPSGPQGGQYGPQGSSGPNNQYGGSQGNQGMGQGGYGPQGQSGPSPFGPQVGASTEFCTKEGFLKTCLSQFQQQSFSEDKVQRICDREVQMNQPYLAQFCNERAQYGSPYENCLNQTKNSCEKVSGALAKCTASANRESIKALIKNKVAVECKRLIYERTGGNFKDSVDLLESVNLTGGTQEDQVLRSTARDKIVLSDAELAKIKAEVRADVLSDLMKLLGLRQTEQKDLAEKQRKQVESLKSARDTMQEICTKVEGDAKAKCDSQVIKLNGQISDLEKETSAIDASANGVLGTLSAILAGK